MNRRRIFQFVAIASAVAAYLTIIVGGDVRSSGAGLACGSDWPLCNGGVIPNLSDPSVLIEFSHRILAAATSVLLLATLLLAFFWFRKDLRIVSLAVTSFALVLSQALLGAVTVQTDLNPTIVTAHLALATATFAAALVLAVLSFVPPSAKPAAGDTPSSPSAHSEVETPATR